MNGWSIRVIQGLRLVWLANKLLIHYYACRKFRQRLRARFFPLFAFSLSLFGGNFFRVVCAFLNSRLILAKIFPTNATIPRTTTSKSVAERLKKISFCNQNKLWEQIKAHEHDLKLIELVVAVFFFIVVFVVFVAVFAAVVVIVTVVRSHGEHVATG